jgi:hypothetical protein
MIILRKGIAMSRQLLQIIYVPLQGKIEPKVARASGFLEKSVMAEKSNQKALAEVSASKLMTVAGRSFSSLWQYISTEKINEQNYHHFEESIEKTNNNHLWIDVDADKEF